ncbi:DUF732 domain-containing protein [Mycolicibacterium celeriflavum]|nr:DUF732 domain-containing protein [Mycolicibacterium celeriflavum]MCV7237142.1 DUF732 domain-containing protein [Mycolicibacterium celeriflavum]ORA48716.1 hypothetical protein BST21_08465 [Mycolicibacterium celeriflavum]
MAGAAAFSLGPAPAVKADAMSYLQSLNNHGMSVYDTSDALRNGYWVCNELNYNTGDVVAERLYYRYASMTVAEAATILMVAVWELCPWHYDPQDLVPVAPPSPLLARAE